MHKGTVTEWTLFMVVAMAAVQMVAQQDDVPILRPKTLQAKPTVSTLLVTCDMACNWALDGEEKGRIDAGGSAKAKHEIGQYTVFAATEDGLDKTWQLVKIVEKQQTVVPIELRPVREARLKVARQAANKELTEETAQERAAREQTTQLQELRDHAAERLKWGLELVKMMRYDQASPLLQKACDGGEMEGCAILGALYYSGNGVAQDYAEAKSLYQKGCNGGVMEGCSGLGVLYDHGQGVTEDNALSRSFFQKACNGGDMSSCRIVGYFYYIGHGVIQDYDQARSLYRKACDGGEMEACDALGVLYQDGHGVARDRALARLFYKKACEGGDERGCTHLGKHH